MSPPLTSFDKIDGRPRYAETSGYGESRTGGFENPAGESRRELGVGVFCAFVAAFPVPISLRHVLHVGQIVAEVEMVWADATPVIASMEHQKGRRDRPPPSLVSETVRSDVLAGNTSKISVPTVVGASSPLPAPLSTLWNPVVKQTKLATEFAPSIPTKNGRAADNARMFFSHLKVPHAN